MEKLSRIEECMVICEHLNNIIKDKINVECVDETNSLIGMWIKYQEEILGIEKVEYERINNELANMKERIDKIEKDMTDAVIDELSRIMQEAYTKPMFV